MKNNRPKHSFWVLYTLIFSFSGCISYQEKARALGTTVFLVFCFLAGGTVLVSKLHDFEWFMNFKFKMKPVFISLSVLGFLSAIGTFILATQVEYHSRLYFFTGTILSVVSTCLQQWARTDDQFKQRIYLKIVSIGLAAILALAFLIFQGEEILG
jgi:hypothetical protein